MLVFMALNFEKSRCRVERKSLLLVQADGAQVLLARRRPDKLATCQNCDPDGATVESRRVPDLSASAPARAHRRALTNCQAVVFRRREVHRRHWPMLRRRLREAV